MATQMVASDVLARLRTAFVPRFPEAKADEILYHYRALRRDARLERYSSCEVEAGKFVEAILKCFHYQRTGEEVDALPAAADQMISQLESDTKHFNDTERLIILKALRLIYTFRNKRGAAHNSSFDPLQMDCALVVALANWVMEELIRLYLTNDDAAVRALVDSLLVKDIPLVEQIDDDRLVLKPGLSARIQLELLLYREPNRCQVKDLARWIHDQSIDNIRTTLRDMRKKNLAHETDAGWLLTEAGIREAEIEIAKLQSGTNSDKPLNRGRAKAGRHVRH
jgi:hypothetical protein